MRRTFIDSGILIAAATGNDDLARRAFHILNDPECVFVTSDFVRLEVLPKAEYHGNDDEVAFYEEFFNAAEQSDSEEIITTERNAKPIFHVTGISVIAIHT